MKQETSNRRMSARINSKPVKVWNKDGAWGTKEDVPHNSSSNKISQNNVVCNKCDNNFNNKWSLAQHMKVCKPPPGKNPYRTLRKRASYDATGKIALPQSQQSATQEESTKGHNKQQSLHSTSNTVFWSPASPLYTTIVKSGSTPLSQSSQITVKNDKITLPVKGTLQPPPTHRHMPILTTPPRAAAPTQKSRSTPRAAAPTDLYSKANPESSK